MGTPPPGLEPALRNARDQGARHYKLSRPNMGGCVTKGGHGVTKILDENKVYLQRNGDEWVRGQAGRTRTGLRGLPAGPPRARRGLRQEDVRRVYCTVPLRAVGRPGRLPCFIKSSPRTRCRRHANARRLLRRGPEVVVPLWLGHDGALVPHFLSGSIYFRSVDARVLRLQ